MARERPWLEITLSIAQQVVAFWDGASAGTVHSIFIARKLGVSCIMVEYGWIRVPIEELVWKV
jgi:hypothetical protein